MEESKKVKMPLSKKLELAGVFVLVLAVAGVSYVFPCCKGMRCEEYGDMVVSVTAWGVLAYMSKYIWEGFIGADDHKAKYAFETAGIIFLIAISFINAVSTLTIDTCPAMKCTTLTKPFVGICSLIAGGLSVISLVLYLKEMKKNDGEKKDAGNTGDTGHTGA